MHRFSGWLMPALLVVCVCSTAGAQNSTSDANTVCNFNPDQQLAVDYRRIQFPSKEKVLGKKVPYGKVWAPGDKPLTLSRSTDTSGKYDESQDLVKIPMEFGKLPQAEPEFTAYFAHTAPNQCNLRLDLGKARAWIVFKQKQKSGAA